MSGHPAIHPRIERNLLAPEYERLVLPLFGEVDTSVQV